jgi:hypothetical protein
MPASIAEKVIRGFMCPPDARLVAYIKMEMSTTLKMPMYAPS